MFQGALGNQITIQSWYMNGLLRDTLSTDNGIILTTAERWVLMIDPQVKFTKEIRGEGQAKIFVHMT